MRVPYRALGWYTEGFCDTGAIENWNRVLVASYTIITIRIQRNRMGIYSGFDNLQGYSEIIIGFQGVPKVLGWL